MELPEHAGPEPLIVHSEFIDPLTFNRPVASAKAGAILVQTAVRPKLFLDMKRALEKEYGATLEIGQHQFLAQGALGHGNAQPLALRPPGRPTRPSLKAGFPR